MNSKHTRKEVSVEPAVTEERSSNYKSEMENGECFIKICKKWWVQSGIWIQEMVLNFGYVAVSCNRLNFQIINVGAASLQTSTVL